MSAATTLTSPQPIVSRVDHVMVRAEDPRPLFDLLTGTLGLPAIQPPTTHLGMFTSAIVGFGDTTLELIRFGELPQTPAQQTSARLWGLAFEPARSLYESQQELARRDIPRLAPQTFERPDPEAGVSKMWTNLSVGLLEHTRRARAAFFTGRLFGGLQQKQMSRMVYKASRGESVRPMDEARMDSMNNIVGHGLVFLTEYDPGFHEPEQGRAEGQGALQEAGGGALGVEGIEEVVVGAKDEEVARKQWGRFFAPVPEVEAGAWRAGEGPVVRVVSQGENRLRTLVLKVSSLVKAREFLEKEKMLGEEEAKESEEHVQGRAEFLRIAPATVGGLDIGLKE